MSIAFVFGFIKVCEKLLLGLLAPIWLARFSAGYRRCL